MTRDKPAIDHLHDPTKAEVYYFDHRTRELVLAKQASRTTEEQPAKSAAKASKKR